jgi:phospholipase/carboxylesterase
MQKNELQGKQIAIGGFSQGCMISLQTGIKRKEKINSIVGYSGKIIDTNHLKNNIISYPNIILMHGDKDEIVPVSFLLEAIEFFNKNKYKIESQIFNNCEHRIPTEGSSRGLEFLKKNLY